MMPLELVSTQTLRPAERLPMWQHAMLENFGVYSRVDRTTTFEAKLEQIRICDVRFHRLTANGYYVERTQALVEHDKAPWLKIALQLRGVSQFEQKGRSVALHTGEWTIYDNAQPYYSSNPANIQLLVLTIPRERISRTHFDLDDAMVRTFSGTGGVGKLAYQFITSMFDEAASFHAYYDSDLVDIVVHLISLVLFDYSRDLMNSHFSARQARRDRIKAHVLQNLRDPDLNIAKVAASLGCSIRYIHKVFEPEGISLSGYIWRERLLHCYEELSNCKVHDSITQIAFSWGFNSSSHFSTRFRAYFGQSPRQYRAGFSSGAGKQPEVPASGQTVATRSGP